MTPEETDLVVRAMALSKRRKLGTLWADSGRFWISENEYDCYGSRVRISLSELKALVIRAELLEAPRKPISSEKRVAEITTKSASCV